MAKKQEIILLHGQTALENNDKLGLAQGEIAILNGENAAKSAIYATDKDNRLVEFSSKAYVDALNLTVNGNIEEILEELDEINGENGKISVINTNIANLQTADNNIIDAYKKADSDIETAYKKADSDIENAYKAADSALQNQINTKVEQSDYNSKITEIEGDIDDLEGLLSGYEGAGSVKAAVDSKVAQSDYDTAISGINTSIQTINTTISELDNTYATDTQLSNAVAALEAKISNAQTAATTKVVEGTDAGNNLSIVESTGETGNTYTINLTDVASAQSLLATDNKVSTLIGNVEGDASKSVRTIASELVAAVVDEAPEAFDTLKEIAEWIGSGDAIEGTTAAQMLTDINANKKAIEVETTRATGVENGLSERIKAVEDDYLKAADKTELSGLITQETGRATSAETALSTRIKTIEDDYLKAADKEGLNGLISGLDARVTVNEGAISTLRTDLNNEITNREAAILSNTVKVVGNSDFVTVTPVVDNTTGTTYTITTSDIAKASDLSALTTRVDTAEGNITTLRTDFDTFAGTTVPQTYETIANVTQKVADLTTLINNEASRADGVEKGIITRVEALETNHIKSITIVEGNHNIKTTRTGNDITFNFNEMVVDGGTYDDIL